MYYISCRVRICYRSYERSFRARLAILPVQSWLAINIRATPHISPSTPLENTAMEAIITLQRFYIFCALAALYVFIGRFIQYWRLRQFKGPPTSGWSWWWHSRAVLSRALYWHYSNATDRYGPIARVAPNLLVTSDGDLWARLNATRTAYYRGEWWYHCARIEAGKDNVFTECDNEKHDQRRKKLAFGYSGKDNFALESSIDVHIKELVHLISSKYVTSSSGNEVTKPMDLAAKMQYFTLDVISHIGLGTPFGHLKTDQDVNGYLKSMEEGLWIATTIFGLGMNWLRNSPLGPSEKDQAGFGKMMAEARKIVEDRKAYNCWSIENYHVIHHEPSAGLHEAAGAEIDGAVKAGITAKNSEDIISEFEARRLPYLSAVIREGMRIHPPVVCLFPRVAPPSGDVVQVSGKEYFIPGGTMIGYASWAMHRTNKSVYGEDAETFRPERWLLDQEVPEEKQRLSQMTKINDMIFGHGRWNCLGKSIALLELHKTIFELFKHFDFALANPHQSLKAIDSMGLWEIKDMNVIVTERQ
ncbi:unnamed protein product [Periconia digitata]|uniref:Pisatin demethylase n=1 Tax=Periconia digitata TaxID=1303443 RepID=A0A9W4UTU2_9PLEO|nr:unnamed protein product [Periconia digitata]